MRRQKRNSCPTTWVCFILLSVFLFAPGYAGDEEKDFSLQELIGMALANSPALRAKRQEVEAKKAAYEASRSLFNPEVEIHVGKGKPYEGQKKVNTEGISVSQALENPLKRKYRLQMVEQEWLASEQESRIFQLEVIFEVKSLYYKILLSRANEDIAEKNVHSFENIHQLIIKRARAGEVKELEAIRLHVETLKAKNELNRIQIELRTAKESLMRYLGESMPPEWDILGELDYTPVALDESVLFQKVLSHPLIQKKERELSSSEGRLNYVKWQRVPDPTLSGFVQDEIDGRNRGLGISFEVPLWNFKSKEIAEAQSLALKQQAELKAQKLDLTTEIKTKMGQLKLSESTMELFLGGLLKQAEDSLGIAEVSYREGEISLIDFLDSQRTYYSVLKEYYRSLYEWNIEKASLEKSVGEELR